MTKPGHVQLARTGWWIRTDRVGTNNNGHHWGVDAHGSELLGGIGAGAYVWAGAGQGVRPLQFVGASINQGNIVPFYPHLGGDLIVVWAYHSGSTATPTKPAAGGTVPAFTVIDNNPGLALTANASSTHYCVASGTTTTSGTWTGADVMIAAVLRGQAAAPIGGHAEACASPQAYVIAPAITMGDTTGKSVLLHFFGNRGNAFQVDTWDAAPAGYTQQVAMLGSLPGGCLLTKNVTTSDGAVTQPWSGAGGNTSYSGATVEILYTTVTPPPPPPPPALPTIISIIPNPGPAGTVTLTGTNYTSPATVSFGASAGTGVVVVSDTQITCTAPAHADGPVTVTVTTPAGTSGGYTFTYQAPPAVSSFHVIQEYFHEGGTQATNQTTDLGIDAASFKAVLTSAESTYLAGHHPIFAYFCIPNDLVGPDASGDYPQAIDDNYRTTMANLVSAYGIDNMYIYGGLEWDNDPGNNGWARDRFVEAGVGGARPDVPTGLTRQQAYDQWMHWYLANNGDGFTHHQLGQILSVPYATRGYKFQSDNINAGTCHFAFEMGVDLVTLQRNNDDVAGLIGSIGFIRGAGTQYGKAWGFDMSHSRTWGPLAGVTTYSGSTLTAGWSEATYKRTRYLEYFSGAHVIMEEASTLSGTTTTINGRGYNPLGIGLRDFCNFALTRHTQRGVPHVPITIMKDHITLLEPRYGQWNQGRYVWISQMATNAGENMMHNLLDMLYPNYWTMSSSTSTAEPWGSGRWGEQFDVCTERASTAALGHYPVVMVSTNAVMDSTLQAKLNTFATNGGIVVINAKQLSGTAHSSITGITITGTASTSGVITWNADSTTTSEPSYNYTTVTLGSASVLAHSGASTPQVTKNVVGAGEVWVTLPDYMSNAGNSATLGVGAKVIDTLIARFAPITITGGNHTSIDYMINKQAGAGGTTTVVTIANTHASGTTWTGTVSFPQGTPVREWISDTTPTSVNSGGRTNVSASVPGGDVRVYAVG